MSIKVYKYKCKYIDLRNLTVSKSIHAVWETKFVYKIHRTVITTSRQFYT